MEIRFIHREVLASHVDNRGVDLHPVNGNLTIYLGELVSNSARGESDNSNTMQFLWREACIEIRRS